MSRKRKSMTRGFPFVIALVAGITAYALFLRKRLLRWGAPETKRRPAFREMNW